MAAGRSRKNLTLMESGGDPNDSLSLGREYPSKLSFIENDDDEKEVDGDNEHNTDNFAEA